MAYADVDAEDISQGGVVVLDALVVPSDLEHRSWFEVVSERLGVETLSVEPTDDVAFIAAQSKVSVSVPAAMI